MLKELYKTIRTQFILKRLASGKVVWNDIWWSLLEYGNTIHLRKDLDDITLRTMDYISADIVAEFKAKEILLGTEGNTTDAQRKAFMELIKEHH